MAIWVLARNALGMIGVGGAQSILNDETRKLWDTPLSDGGALPSPPSTGIRIYTPPAGLSSPLPSRRLPVTGGEGISGMAPPKPDSGSGTKDAGKPVTTVNQVLNTRTFGSLLSTGISDEGLEIPTYKDTNTYSRWQTEQTKKQERLIAQIPKTFGANTILRESEVTSSTTEPKPKTKEELTAELHDRAFILNLKSTRLSNDPTIDYIYTTEGILEYFAIQVNRSNVADYPVYSLIPKSYNGREIEAAIDDRTTQTDFLEVVSLAEEYSNGLFPLKLPRYLTQEKDDKTQVEINSTSELVFYLFLQVDTLFGQFPIEIEIEDSNLLESGNQSKTISLPNLGESIAEMMGVTLNNSQSIELLVNLCIKNLIQGGQSLSNELTVRSYVKAISDYLGYKPKYSDEEADILFSPDKTNIAEFLEPSKLKVTRIEHDSDKDLQDDLFTLLQSAAIIRAVNQRSIQTGTEEQQIKNIINSYLQTIDDTKPIGSDPEDNEIKDSWSIFTEEVEQGFIGSSGISDATNPYGKPFGNRPRIKTIGNDDNPTS
jgi:predicted RNA-binding protein Jag